MLAMMIKSTVRLDAQVQGGNFQASGVIFNVVNNKVQILTAAHNLMFWGGLKVPPNDWDALAGQFAAVCKIRYNPKDGKFNGAVGDPLARPNGNNDGIAVSQVVNKCNSQDRNATCYYDLAVITCVDTNLANFAKTFLGNNYALGPTAEYAATNQGGFLNTKKYMYFQLGYGKTTDTRKPQTLGKDDEGKVIVKFGVAEDVKCGEGAGMDAHHLHYRVAKPLNAGYACFYDQVAANTEAPAYSANCAAIEFRASKNNSTAEGDSGGPVYAIEYTEEETEDEEGEVTNTVTYKKATLLGLTTGSDMMAGKEPPGITYFNDISTSVIPYLKTRQQG